MHPLVVVRSVILVCVLTVLGPSFALAQVGTPAGSPTAAGVAIEDLYTFTLPASAVPEAVVGMAFLRFTAAPGTVFDFSVACWASPAFDAWYVETGSFVIQPAAPARVVRAADGIGAAGEPVAIGEEIVLQPGDLFIYTDLPLDPGTFRTAGEESVSGIVLGVWGSEVAGCPPTGMVEPWLEYREGAEWTLPPGDLAFALRRITLAPTASVPLPENDPGSSLTILHAEEGVPTYEGTGVTRLLTNAGNDPLVALLLSITLVGPATGTPAVGIPQP